MSITGYYWLTFNLFRVRWVSLQIFNRDDLFGVSSKIPDPKPRKETITTYTRYLLHMLLPIGLRNVLCRIRPYSGHYQVKHFSKLYSYYKFQDFIPFTAFVKSQDPGISCTVCLTIAVLNPSHLSVSPVNFIMHFFPNMRSFNKQFALIFRRRYT